MTYPFREIFGHCLTQPGASELEIRRTCAGLGLHPPADYLAALQFTNGAEGFIGQSYLRLYSLADLRALNQAYQVSRFTPGLVLFGSTGEGEGYAFDTRQASSTIVQIPFIPLDFEQAEWIETSFLDFLLALRDAPGPEPTAGPPLVELAAVGHEAHQRQPLAFGGDPADPDNTVLVPAPVHAKICTFWNDVWHSQKVRVAQ